MRREASSLTDRYDGLRSFNGKNHRLFREKPFRADLDLSLLSQTSDGRGTFEGILLVA